MAVKAECECRSVAAGKAFIFVFGRGADLSFPGLGCCNFIKIVDSIYDEAYCRAKLPSWRSAYSGELWRSVIGAEGNSCSRMESSQPASDCDRLTRARCTHSRDRRKKLERYSMSSLNRSRTPKMNIYQDSILGAAFSRAARAKVHDIATNGLRDRRD